MGEWSFGLSLEGIYGTCSHRTCLLSPTLFLAFCAAVLLGVGEFHGEASVEATLCFGANPENAVAAHVGFLHSFLEIGYGSHFLVVHLGDDDALGDTGVLHLALLDCRDEEAVELVVLSVIRVRTNKKAAE